MPVIEEKEIAQPVEPKKEGIKIKGLEVIKKKLQEYRESRKEIEKES